MDLLDLFTDAITVEEAAESIITEPELKPQADTKKPSYWERASWVNAEIDPSEVVEREQVVQSIIDLNEELECVVVGRWLFVHGAEKTTRAHIDDFKQLGLQWHRAKKQWYWQPNVADADDEYTEEQEIADREIAYTKASAISTELKIEICGRWVWVSGPTKTFKTELNEAGFSYAPRKQMWFWKPKNSSGAKWGKKRDEESLDFIHRKYGSTVVQGDDTDNTDIL